MKKTNDDLGVMVISRDLLKNYLFSNNSRIRLLHQCSRIAFTSLMIPSCMVQRASTTQGLPSMVCAIPCNFTKKIVMYKKLD